jgi:hypothetical protein
VAIDYLTRVRQVMVFAALYSMVMNTCEEIDAVLSQFLNEVFLLGSDLSEATKYLAAIMDHFPMTAVKSALARSRRCLQGWGKLDPGKTRPPLAWQLLALIAPHMLGTFEGLHMALLLLTMFACYFRPGEAMNLAESQLVRPSQGFQKYAINLHSSDQAQSSKMGLQDESIMLDSKTLPKLGMWLARISGAMPAAQLFKTQPVHFNAAWKAALVAIGLPANYAVPYQLRHSGPSHDRLLEHRPLDEVKQRGRWKSDSSVKRYEAHALVQQEFQKLSLAIRLRAHRAASELEGKVQSALNRFV